MKNQGKEKIKEKKATLKERQKVRSCKKLEKIAIFLRVVSMAVLLVIGAAVVTRYVGLNNNQKVVFSHQNGFYDEDFEVELSAETKERTWGISVRYNLSGDDLSRTYTEYSKPIRLTVPEVGYKVYTITATLCYFNEKCVPPYTRTYVLGKKLREDVNLDIININSSFDNLYSYENGIMVKGKTYDDNLRRNHDAPLIEGNYNQRSEDWIRDSYVTMFSSDGKILFDKNLGIQISGNTSALADVKSMKIMGNKKYGYSKIPFDFGDGVELYNSIKLSNGGQDHWWGHVRSSVVSRLAEQAGFDGYSPTKRVTVFLNGRFYGVYDAQLNYSDSNIAKIFRLPSNNFIEKYKSEEMTTFEDAGIRSLFETDLNDASNRVKLEEKVDMDNYLLYYALQILWQNIDWPVNNFEIWRYTGGYDSGNFYTDGRWRFLIYDVDCAYYCNEYMNHYAYDFFAELISEDPTRENTSFKNVMEPDYYRNRFIKILKELIDGPFATKNVLDIINSETDKIDKQLQLWYKEDEYNNWMEEVNHLKRLVLGVNSMLRADILKYYKINI